MPKNLSDEQLATELQSALRYLRKAEGNLRNIKEAQGRAKTAIPGLSQVALEALNSAMWNLEGILEKLKE